MACLASIFLLSACGGGGNDDTTPPAGDGFTVAGTVNGLGGGKRVVLQNNGTGDLEITTEGPFSFPDRVPSGSAYAVTVKTQPVGQSCTIEKGTGVATANIDEVLARCTNLPAAAFSVGGRVSGLAANTTLVLQNNNGDDLTVTANGGFTFAAPLLSGASYAISVKSQPVAQICTVRQGSGTMSAANVSTVEISCAANTDVSLPEGDWQMDLCVAIRANTWGRALWRIAKQGSMTTAVNQGMVVYNNATCTGTGAPEVSGSSSLGTMVFNRSAATATLTAFWGTWNLPNGSSSPTIWARKGAHLCILGDATPSVLTTPQLVESSANLSIAGKNCYTKL
ncbi:MAG: hypothetical protein I8H77_02545 [Comamonadaceae bacterium]|nr:hypothetical protein [Comamonadaceae bacterium]